MIRRRLKSQLNVDISTCIGCARCKAACATGAIELFACIPLVALPPKTGEPRQRPEINQDKCTRCYRCLEKCPHAAIGLRKSWIMRLLKIDG